MTSQSVLKPQNYLLPFSDQYNQPAVKLQDFRQSVIQNYLQNALLLQQIDNPLYLKEALASLSKPFSPQVVKPEANSNINLNLNLHVDNGICNIINGKEKIKNQNLTQNVENNSTKDSNELSNKDTSIQEENQNLDQDSLKKSASISQNDSEASSKTSCENHSPNMAKVKKIKKIPQSDIFFEDLDLKCKIGKAMKSKKQNAILENEFAKDQQWSKEKRKDLAKKLGLEPNQVYKWLWDKCESLRKKQKEISQSYEDVFAIEKQGDTEKCREGRNIRIYFKVIRSA